MVIFSNLNGYGAIYVRNSTTGSKYLIEDCIFKNCSQADFHGGAITFGREGSLGSVIQNRICSSKCKVRTNWNGHHSFIKSNNLEKSFMISSSIVSSGENEAGNAQILSEHAQLIFSKNNVSNSVAYSIAAAGFGMNSSGTVSFCTFSSNLAKSNSIIKYYGLNQKSEVSQHHCIFISNTCNTSTILSSIILDIANCIFTDNRMTLNEGKYFFQNDNTMTIRDCYIDSYPVSISGTPVNSAGIKNIPFELSLSYLPFDQCGIYHYSCQTANLNIYGQCYLLKNIFLIQVFILL